MATPVDTSNILLAIPDLEVTGGISIGPAALDATNFPTDASTAYNAALKMEPAGYLTEDGFSKTPKRDSEEIKAWGGDSVLVVQKEHGIELKWTFLESKRAAVLKAIYGSGSVTVAGNKITIAEDSKPLAPLAIGFDMLSGQDDKVRIFAPNVRITDIGEIKHTHSEAITYEITATCMPAKNGKKLLTFIDGPTASA